MAETSLTSRFVIYALLSWVDAITTVALAKESGPDVELNPIAHFFMARYGVLTLILYKAILVGLMLIVVSWVARKESTSANLIMRYANWGMLVVCIWGGVQAYRFI